MADYYPLLARALESLPEKTPQARRVVYDRAKAALLGQLKNVNPPLGEDAIQREISSLEEAIARLEQSDEVPSVPASSVVEMRAERPKVDPSKIRKTSGKPRRSVLTAVGLVVVIVPIAVLAWLWRDRPAAPTSAPGTPPATSTGEQPASPAAGSDPKFPERVAGGGGGEGAPAGGPSQGGGQAGSGASPSAPGLPVAQKAALVEENTEDPKQPKITSGRAFWRLDSVNPGHGQPLDTVVRASVEIPDRGMSLQLILRRNRDAALPATHTMELSFTTPSGDAGRAVRDVNPPLFRADDGARGVPVAALAVPVKENLFLIGLSNLPGDVERNVDLIRNRNWIELPVRFGSGTRATLIFEKGTSGERAVTEAFKTWSQP